jgi:hypothetical protein
LSPCLLDDCCAGFWRGLVQRRDVVKLDFGVERGLQSWFEVVGMVVFGVIVAVVVRMVVVGHCERFLSVVLCLNGLNPCSRRVCDRRRFWLVGIQLRRCATGRGEWSNRIVA